jgi:hypothetical protein
VREFQAAAEARLAAVWMSARVHPIGGVPASPATPYAAVGVDSPSYTNGNLAAQAGGQRHTIAVQVVGANKAEVDFGAEKAAAAFVEHSLAVAGFDCAPPNPEDVVSSPVIRDPDAGGVLVCTVLYPFTAYPI